jgi:hypothetical protein
MVQAATMPTLRLVEPPEAAERWPEFRIMLDRAIQHGRGELEVDDILVGVEKSSMGILAQEEKGTLELVLAFEVINYPRRSVLNIIAAGGKNGAGAVPHYGLIDAIAKTMGASVVRCFCRPSVARYIKRLFPDTQQAYVVLEREVA